MGVGGVDDDGVELADHARHPGVPRRPATAGSRPVSATIGPPALSRGRPVPQDRVVPSRPAARPMTAPELGSLTWLPADRAAGSAGRAGRRGAVAAARAGLGRRDRRRARRHRGLQRRLRRAARGLGELRGRGRPAGRARPRSRPASCWPPPAPTSTGWSAGTWAPARRRSRRRTSPSPSRAWRSAASRRWGCPPAGRCWSTREVEAADFVVIGSGTRGEQARRGRVAAGGAADGGGARGARPAAAGRPPPPAAPAPAARPARPGRQRRRAGASGPAEPADDDRRYLEDRPPHWGSD